MHASAAKAGVDAVTRGLATEWQEYGIRGVLEAAVSGSRRSWLEGSQRHRARPHS